MTENRPADYDPNSDESPTIDPDSIDTDSWVRVTNDDIPIRYDEDAETVVIEWRGEEREFDLAELFDGAADERAVCPARYCENWADECERHGR